VDLSAIWTMAASDLRQRIRDRSVLIFALVVPIALMFVFNLLFSGAGSSQSLKPITVQVAAEPDDQIALGLVQMLSNIDGLKVTAAAVPLSAVDRMSTQVDSGSVTVGVVFPAGFDAAVQKGGSPQVQLIQPGDGGLEPRVVGSIVSGYVERVASASQAASAAGSLGVPAAEISKVAQAVATAEPTLTAKDGAPSDQQLSTGGYLVAGQAALFMFFTVGFGVIAYIQEREQGTLPRLASMPIPPRSILLAKVLVSFILGVVATSVLLGVGSLFFGVGFGDVVPVAVVVVAAVIAVTSLVLLVTRVARTAEQAQGTNAIVGILMGVLGGSFFPISGSGLLARLSDLTPTAAFIRGLGITNGGGGVTDLGAPLAVFAVFAVVSLGVSFVLGDDEEFT
jgi:ABC-2 type transport system permease protein